MSRSIHRIVLQILATRPQKTCGSVRLYGRWMHRDPAKILLPFEDKSKINLKKEKVISLDPEIMKKTKERPGKKIDDVQNENEQTERLFPFEKTNDIKEKRCEKIKKRLFYLNQSKVFDDNNEILYEKLKANDGRISNLLVTLKSKKDRIRSNQVLVEGWRLIVDGLEAKCSLKYIIFSRTEDLNNVRPFLPKTGVKLYKVSYKEMELWSDVETCPGIFGIFELPKPENVKLLSRPLPLQFICDNIRMPGNLGAILRIAVGAGCEKVLLTRGCVDLWEPKVIRSAAGAHFRLPIHTSVEWENMPKLLEKETSIFVADSNAKVMSSEETTEIKENLIEGMQIPVLPYYGIEYSTLNHITLIIGGETEGISEDSYMLAASRNGLRLNIPLQKGIDSLNTGMAAAVIAFEIRKQLIQAWTHEKLERKSVNAT